MFNADFMVSQSKEYAIDTYNALSSLPSIESSSYLSALEEKYTSCEAISVDFAIMEKTNSLYVIPADFGWDDVGSWLALGRYLDKDECGNIIKGENRSINSHNNTIFSSTKEIILLDVDELFVIETEEKVVVGRKESMSKVHELRN